ncbi:MAG: hypothetical protein AAFX99_37435, partial [Myxococcota bacterium]
GVAVGEDTSSTRDTGTLEDTATIEDTAMSPEDEPPPATPPGEPIDRQNAGEIHSCNVENVVPPRSAVRRVKYMTFYAAGLEHYPNFRVTGNPCPDDPYTITVFEANRNDNNRRNYQHLNAALMGSYRLHSPHDCSVAGMNIIQERDFNDWRPVTMVPLAPGEEPIHMADVDTL